MAELGYWEKRKIQFRRRREFKALLERSSLAEDKLWVDCPTHGRQARDPFTERCIKCG